MLAFIKNIIGQLQDQNHKAKSLAFVRVALCIWYLKELLFRWPALELLYNNHSILSIKPAYAFQLFHINASFLKEHYLLLVITCIILLILNLLGIGKNLVAFLLFIALTILYNLNNQFGNSGDEMALLLFFYLSFANSYRHWSLSKYTIEKESSQRLCNLVSNLVAYSIILNLCLVYFLAGYFKLQNFYWLQGSGILYFLNDERFSIFASGTTVQLPTWLMLTLNYGIIAFELGFPFLVWFKKSRNFILILGLLLHLGIYLFLMIYGMSIVFVLQYALFISDEELSRGLQKINSIFKKQKPFPSVF